MMVTAAMLGWALGYALAAVTRTHEDQGLVMPVPARLRRFIDR